MPLHVYAPLRNVAEDGFELSSADLKKIEAAIGQPSAPGGAAGAAAGVFSGLAEMPGFDLS